MLSHLRSKCVLLLQKILLLIPWRVYSFIHTLIFIRHISHHYNKVKEVNEADGEETWKRTWGL